MSSSVIVTQLNVKGFDDNFSYILFDQISHDAAIVDPCGDISIIENALKSYQEFTPRYILLTHGHYDHISGVDSVKNFFPAKVAAHKNCTYNPDIPLDNGSRLPFGNLFIETIYTPGHTSDSVIYRLSDNSALFTGDTLFIDWCGFCNAEDMFNTMRNIIFPLPDSLEVYSGHNYGRKPHAKLGEEKCSNPYLATTDFNSFKQALKEL